MIDTMVTSGETKWNVSHGLVLLLPHGFEGNGPEHSSARVERFLTLTDASDEPPTEDQSERDLILNCNFVVANCTTAAQYFHLLRRQMRRTFRKPLVVMSPKSMLKQKSVCSSIEEFSQGKRFQRVLVDQNPELVADDKVRKVVFCSGRVYYDLETARAKRGMNDVAIVRVEQMSPFPFRALAPNTQKYKNASITWAQEESKNAGGWSFVEPRFRAHLKDLNHIEREISYAGRPACASVSTGYSSVHK
jgi:2-oxoglutarate dehydrogenase E1 component